MLLDLTDFKALLLICHVRAEYNMLEAEITLSIHLVIQGLQESDHISLRLLIENKDADQGSEPHMKVSHLQFAFRESRNR